MGFSQHRRGQEEELLLEAALVGALVVGLLVGLANPWFSLLHDIDVVILQYSSHNSPFSCPGVSSDGLLAHHG